MQYTLAAHLKLQPDEGMPAKTLLYFYSSFRKDEQEARQKEELARSAKRHRSRHIPMNKPAS